jgi:hypothetical protein
LLGKINLLSESFETASNIINEAKTEWNSPPAMAMREPICITRWNLMEHSTHEELNFPKARPHALSSHAADLRDF